MSKSETKNITQPQLGNTYMRYNIYFIALLPRAGSCLSCAVYTRAYTEMDDGYEQIELPSIAEAVPASNLYEAASPLATGRSQTPLPAVPSGVKTSVGFTEPCTTEMDHSTRYGGISRPVTIRSDQQPIGERCGIAFSSQGKQKGAPPNKMSRIATYVLLALSIALSVTLLILFILMGLGRNKEEFASSNVSEEIKTMKTIIERNQSTDATQATTNTKNLKSIVERLQLSYTDQASEIKSMKSIIKILQASQTSLTANVKNNDDDIESLVSNYTAQASEIKSMDVAIDTQQSNLSIQASEIKRMEVIVESLQSNVTDVISDVEKNDDKIENLESNDTAMALQITNIKAFLRSLQSNYNSQMSEINSMKGIIKSLQENYTSLNSGYPYTTCHELQENGITKSGYFTLRSPSDGTYQVHCQFTKGRAITQVSHQDMHEIENPVLPSQRCSSSGCYSWTPRYLMTWNQTTGIVSKSAECRQYSKTRCVGTGLLGRGYAWWVSRDGERMNYWGGATSKRDNYCACGETSTCVNNRYKCNCDTNSPTEAIDEGYLTDKTKLPMRELRFGDLNGSNEFVWHTLGMLECWGKNMTIRLTGSGATLSQGRVEVYKDGSWGTICDDNWDITDENVVCQQLGFSRATSVTTRAQVFGRGSGTIWMDDVACTGRESSIWDCPHTNHERENCNHSEDAGVYCG